MIARKVYIGDAVYAEILDGRLVLTTENGLTLTNRIVLDEDVWQLLVEYVELAYGRRPPEAEEEEEEVPEPEEPREPEEPQETEARQEAEAPEEPEP